MSTVQISFDGFQHIELEMDTRVASQLVRDWEHFVNENIDQMLILYPISGSIFAVNFARIAWMRAQVKDGEQ